jgi:hypothetical protein
VRVGVPYRYSAEPTCPGAEAPKRLSCGCAHFRVQPVVARRPDTALGPEGPSVGAEPAPLMEFFPLRRVSPGESTPPRFASTGYVPSSGFLTLPTAFSSPERPAFFQTGGVHGVRSSGIFPRGQVPQLIIAELPSWRFLLRNAYVMVAVRRRASWILPVFHAHL